MKILILMASIPLVFLSFAAQTAPSIPTSIPHLATAIGDVPKASAPRDDAVNPGATTHPQRRADHALAILGQCDLLPASRTNLK